MINKDYVCKLGLEFIDEYSFDDAHHSFVFKHNNILLTMLLKQKTETLRLKKMV